MAWAASQQPPVPAACALSVATVPTGAAVYVDGELQGATPVDLTDISPGDHRVRVVKQGYLENSRVVGLRSGKSESLSVRLTPDASYSTTATIQVEDYEPEGEGGGGSKLLLIGLGAVAVGAGAFLLLRNTNEPAVVSGVDINPRLGLAAITSISFTAVGASDPDDDSLTYNWDFGDGATATGQTASHTYSSADTYLVTVTVSDGEEQATASDTAVIRSLSGVWSGPWGVFGPVMMRLTQSQTTVTGTYIDPEGPGPPAGPSVPPVM
jgi:hypothetical protein